MRLEFQPQHYDFSTTLTQLVNRMGLIQVHSLSLQEKLTNVLCYSSKMTTGKRDIVIPKPRNSFSNWFSHTMWGNQKKFLLFTCFIYKLRMTLLVYLSKYVILKLLIKLCFLILRDETKNLNRSIRYLKYNSNSTFVTLT